MTNPVSQSVFSELKTSRKGLNLSTLLRLGGVVALRPSFMKDMIHLLQIIEDLFIPQSAILVTIAGGYLSLYCPMAPLWIFSWGGTFWLGDYVTFMRHFLRFVMLQNDVLSIAHGVPPLILRGIITRMVLVTYAHI